MRRIHLSFAALAIFAAAAQAAAPQYVIQISVDGLGSSYLQTLLDANRVPNFKRLITEGSSTLNARNDYDLTVTLPNHTTMVTGRGVHGVASNGHKWTSNSDPAVNQTIHSVKGSYVASVYDVAHDNGLRTAMYATKTKFSLFDTSYNATNGAMDVTGPDNTRDKLDRYYQNASSTSITNMFVSEMNANPFNFAFLHYSDGDNVGHSSGWGTTAYMDAIVAVDGQIGAVLSMIENNTLLNGNTAIILTADHGGYLKDHSTASDARNYTIPFMVWGGDAAAGSDLYALNPGVRLDPLTGRPTYSAILQPIRNGDGANLALDMLALGAIPGSTINASQDLVVPEPASIALLAAGCVALLRRSRRKAA